MAFRRKPEDTIPIVTAMTPLPVDFMIVAHEAAHIVGSSFVLSAFVSDKDGIEYEFGSDERSLYVELPDPESVYRALGRTPNAQIIAELSEIMASAMPAFMEVPSYPDILAADENYGGLFGKHADPNRAEDAKLYGVVCSIIENAELFLYENRHKVKAAVEETASLMGELEPKMLDAGTRIALRLVPVPKESRVSRKIKLSDLPKTIHALSVELRRRIAGGPKKRSR